MLRASLFLALSSVAVVPASLPAQAPPSPAWDSVATILQTSVTAAAGYYRYNLPRRDITLRVGDVTVSPALALGSWAGFSGTPRDATMMGDLVLIADEVKPVLAELARQRIGVTALHNHLTGEEPRITYLHFHGRGRATDLAVRFDRVVARTATPRPVTAPPPAALTIDTGVVFRTLGKSGTARGNVAQLGFVLVPGTVTLDGQRLVPALAYGSPVNIQMVDGARAVATGDFAVAGGRVAAVLAALTGHGIAATAMHSHLIGESPRLYFIHFWADGALPEVLGGLTAALDAAR